MSGPFSIEIDGLTIEGVYLGSDDGAEIHLIRTAEDTLYVGGSGDAHRDYHEVQRFLAVLPSDQRERLVERVAEIAERMLRGELAL
ncbi:MAG: hypothetical protein M3N56_10505 [Actinomycetota bacterium]|nr:hypothetical protein [Actinomycetota bacterium]